MYLNIAEDFRVRSVTLHTQYFGNAGLSSMSFVLKKWHVNQALIITVIKSVRKTIFLLYFQSSNYCNRLKS